MKKTRRICALTMAVLVIVCIGASASLIAYEADHDCTGPDCPICAAVAMCTNALRLLSCAAFLSFAALPAWICRKQRASRPSEPAFKSTPVALKVLLLN